MKTWMTVLTSGLLLLAAHGASAETVFVAPQGNDANPGTEEQPFASLERAGTKSGIAEPAGRSRPAGSPSNSAAACMNWPGRWN